METQAKLRVELNGDQKIHLMTAMVRFSLHCNEK